MPRQSGPPKPKAVNYSMIDRSKPEWKLLDKLVRKHHQHLIDARIALAWRYALKKDADRLLVLGKCVKASDLSRELVDWDFVILLNYEVWTSPEFGDHQKEALLDHELCHAQISKNKDGTAKEDDRGRRVYRVRKHDIEEFTEIVTRHGTYKRDLEEFGKVILAGKGQPLLKIAEG